MFEAGKCSPQGGTADIFVFAPRAPRATVATVSWQTERRGLMVLGGRPSREMLSGPPQPRRLAGCCLGVMLATWDAGSALALSAELTHPARKPFEREGHHAILADDLADHAGGLGPAPLGLGNRVDPEMARPAGG